MTVSVAAIAERSVASAGAAPSSAAVRSWLKGMGLAEYAPGLIAAGYDDMDVFAAGVSAEELRAAGVRKPGHVRKLLLRAAALGGE